MQNIFQTLLRSNFRCGQMLYSRADAMAGCFAAPIVHPGKIG